MYLKVTKCCFCWSLRWGIIFFAYINVLFSVVAMASMMVTTELYKTSLVGGDVTLEMVTATILFAILGMSIILNVLLLIAEYQKDVQMLKLYNKYEVATTLAALLPTFILLSRLLLVEVLAASFAIAMQLYVIILVRSEVLKLERKSARRVDEATAAADEVIVVVPDTDTLI